MRKLRIASMLIVGIVVAVFAANTVVAQEKSSEKEEIKGVYVYAQNVVYLVNPEDATYSKVYIANDISFLHSLPQGKEVKDGNYIIIDLDNKVVSTTDHQPEFDSTLYVEIDMESKTYQRGGISQSFSESNKIQSSLDIHIKENVEFALKDKVSTK